VGGESTEPRGEKSRKKVFSKEGNHLRSRRAERNIMYETTELKQVKGRRPLFWKMPIVSGLRMGLAKIAEKKIVRRGKRETVKECH